MNSATQSPSKRVAIFACQARATVWECDVPFRRFSEVVDDVGDV